MMGRKEALIAIFGAFEISKVEIEQLLVPGYSKCITTTVFSWQSSDMLAG